MAEVTAILRAIDGGDRQAAGELLPLVYDELRHLAAARLASEGPGQTLQPTALVHEAYVRLVAGTSESTWDSRRHFFAAAAEAMRRILVERARRKAAVKHGGELRRIDFDEQLVFDDGRSANLVALDEALSELESHDARAAEIVKLRFFAGMTLKDAAAAMQVSDRTADRLWGLAKAWLYKRLASS
jgi:RNA polymerase sigma factor (TIGR02999 family)